MAFFRKVLKKTFNHLFSKRFLIVTNTATGVISITLGDTFQQHLEHYFSRQDSNANDEKFEWDKVRTRQMMSIGVYFSLFGHWWYTWLDRRFPNSVPKKLLAEALVGPPLVASVFLVLGRVNGERFEESWLKMKKSMPLVCISEWIVFLPLQWINFTYLPSRYRYLYVATISVGYDAFLSYILHRHDRGQLFLISQEEQEKET